MVLFSKLWAFFITFPFAAFVTAYYLLYLWKKNRKMALRWSINITNIFLIYAVSVMYSVNWPDALSAWWWILLFFVGMAAALGVLQWKIRGKLSLPKIGFSTWRLSFLFFGVTYLFLFSVGIWLTMQTV